jgi:hypothetical protein
MPFFAYAGFTILGLLFSFMGLVFAMTGGTDSLYITAGPLLLAYAGAIFYVTKRANEGNGAKVAVVLALPMPFVSAVFVAYSIGSHVISFIIPDSETFSSECKTAGAVYIKAPALPVHSIAYYNETNFRPHFTSLRVSWGSRISSLSYESPPSHPSLEFTETGPNAFGHRYTRHPKAALEYGVDALTADALVKIKMSPEKELQKALGSQGVVSYELTVIDRRTNEQLAQLRYVTDTENNRACGLTGENTLSERVFILKAIGLQ